MSVEERLESIRARIDDACRACGRAPDEVRLVAVSKRQPDERLRAAYDAGHRDFGENFVQQMLRKKALLPDDARWHLIGHVQSNKAAGAAEASLVHTLDSVKLVKKIDAARSSPVRCLLQVNVSGEASKAGVAPDDAPAIVESTLEAPNVDLVGLMCIPEVGEGASGFAALRSQRDALAAQFSIALPELSMGMSGDFEDAVREGATLVRIGTAIFGPRG